MAENNAYLTTSEMRTPHYSGHYNPTQLLNTSPNPMYISDRSLSVYYLLQLSTKSLISFHRDGLPNVLYTVYPHEALAQYISAVPVIVYVQVPN